MRDARGATSIEYAMIAVLVSIAGIAALVLMGPMIVEMLSSAGAGFDASE